MEEHVGTKMFLTHYQGIWLNSNQGIMRLANDVNRGASWEATQDFNKMFLQRRQKLFRARQE